MSYKTCFFGFPTKDISVPEIWKLFKPMAEELQWENDWRELYLVTNSDEEAEASGLRLVNITVKPATGGVISRDFFIERWPTDGPAFFVLSYDDQNGVFYFQHHPKEGRSQSILTNGHRVGLNNLTLTVDYAQKPFTNDELDAAFKLPEEELSEAQCKALMDWDDALTIGLRQFGFELPRTKCLDLLYAKRAWPLLTDELREADYESFEAGGVIDFYVSPWTFESHGLEGRSY